MELITIGRDSKEEEGSDKAEYRDEESAEAGADCRVGAPYVTVCFTWQLRLTADSSEQLETDVESAKAEIEEAESGAGKSKAELEALKETLKVQKVSLQFEQVLGAVELTLQADYKAVEAKLQSERAVLIAFDTELADLEKDIKKKKREISDAELAVKKLEHELASAVKEKSGAEAFREGLERQFSWIKEDSG